MRIPLWLHEELANEAYHRNVSINQLCFEALVARRALVKKPQLQTALEGLDRRRTQDRKVIQAEVAKTVTELAARPPDRPPPNARNQRILDAVRTRGRPSDAEDIARETGLPLSDVVPALVQLWAGRWLRQIAGRRYAPAHGAAALGIDGFG